MYDQQEETINELDTLQTYWETSEQLTLIFKQGGDIQVDDLSFVVTIELMDQLTEEAIGKLDETIGKSVNLILYEEVDEQKLRLEQIEIRFTDYKERYTNQSEEDWKHSYLALRKKYIQALTDKQMDN